MLPIFGRARRRRSRGPAANPNTLVQDVDMEPAKIAGAKQRMESHMAADEDPPFKEWEQLNEKLKQVKKARKRGKATTGDVSKAQEEYDRAAARIEHG
jgi:hypothetical protein